MVVVGGALAVFGLTGFTGSIDSIGGSISGGFSWDAAPRAEAVIGVALFLLGMCFKRREP